MWLDLPGCPAGQPAISGHWSTTFTGNAGGRSPGDWVRVAVLAGADHEDEARDLARLPGWQMPHLTDLILNFTNDPGQLTLAQWQILAGHASLHNHEKDVAGFARLGGWAALRILGLVAHYEAGDGGRTAQDWIRIAGCRRLIDQEDGVRDLARMGGGRSATEIITLANLYSGSQGMGGRNLADWILSAGVGAGPAISDYADERVNPGQVSGFDPIGNWDRNSYTAMIREFHTNAGGRTIQEWEYCGRFPAIQGPGPGRGPLYPPCRLEQCGHDHIGGFLQPEQWWADRSPVGWGWRENVAFQNPWDDVAVFARLGWHPANIAALAGYFQAGDGGRTARDWARMAGFARFTNHENDVRDHARIPGWLDPRKPDPPGQPVQRRQRQAGCGPSGGPLPSTGT